MGYQKVRLVAMAIRGAFPFEEGGKIWKPIKIVSLCLTPASFP